MDKQKLIDHLDKRMARLQGYLNGTVGMIDMSNPTTREAIKARLNEIATLRCAVLADDFQDKGDLSETYR